MRENLDKNKIPIPKYEKITTEEEVIKFAKNFNYPIVIKAVDNAGNRGISIVKNQKDILESIKNGYKYSNKKYLLVETQIIVGCFVIWFILFYWSIHKKNKDRRTPRAVYNVG